MLLSSSFIHSGTGSNAKVRGFHQFFTGSIPWLTIQATHLRFQSLARLNQLFALAVDSSLVFKYLHPRQE